MPASLTISLAELNALKNYILKMGLKRARPTNEYELLRIEDGKVKIVVYKSGKVVHNNSPESKTVIDNTLRSETEYQYLLGSDETGKGEWYGPLVVVCVALTPREVDKARKMGARDSKTIKAPEIRRLATLFRKENFFSTPRVLPPSTYNARYEEFEREGKSLNDLLAWAHARVIKDTVEKLKFDRAKVVIDKFDVAKTYQRLYGLDTRRIEIIQKSKGESETPVAVASIIAKDIFEKEVEGLSKAYGIDLKRTPVSRIPLSILPQVAKLHFSNVREAAEGRPSR